MAIKSFELFSGGIHAKMSVNAAESFMIVFPRTVIFSSTTLRLQDAILYMYVQVPGGVLPCNRLMGMCRWMGSHFHDWIDYNGVAFSIGTNRVTRMGSHICGISEVSKFRQVGIWGIFAQK